MKILVVEDDQGTGSILSEALSEHYYLVNLVTDGETGYELAQMHEYDLILLDVMIPGLDGISLCQKLRDKGCQTPILLITAKDSSTDRVMGLDAGADDYVVKPFDLPELMARIRALLRRETARSTSVISWQSIHLDSTKCEVKCGDRPLHLTPKEYCLLELFLQNPKRIFSRTVILNKLWDFAENPSEETVSTHIKCLRQKLKAGGSEDPIETVHGLGYRLRSVAQPQPDLASDQPKQNHPIQQSSHLRQKVHAATNRVWNQFKERFAAQIACLEAAANSLTIDNLTIEQRQQASVEAHRLAGSLGIFGFKEGSSLAKELEELLHPDNSLTREQAAQMSLLVKQLLKVTAQPPKENFNTPTSVSSSSPLILIVDDDLMLAERLRIEAIAWNLQVEIATDLTVARKTIAQTAPQLILLDLNFPGAEDGLTLLEELSQRPDKIPVVAFTRRDNLEDRVRVARLGGCAFLNKPLPAYQILKVITDILNLKQSKVSNRVMAVDDDDRILQSLSDLLTPLEIEVTPLTQTDRFWEVLTQTNPRLLLLDLEMPGFDGIDLCQALRNDPNWQNLPVIFLSAHTNKTVVDRIFAAGADDFISKSSDRTELVDRIIRRMQLENERSQWLVGV